MSTTTVSHRSATLTRLLDDELVFSPSYRGYFSNHLAMALVALEQLGARPDVLESVFEAHARNDAEMRDDVEVLDERRREVRRDGIAAVVQSRVPALADAPGTALFHPMIRLGYALDVGHEGQVAAALLDWEGRHAPLPVPPPTPGTRRLRDVASELAGQPSGTWPHTFDLPGIAQRPELRDALTGVAHDEHTLDDVSSFALAAHLAADDFITLHLVTGARAARTVSAWLDDDTALQLAAHMVPVMAIAYAAVGAPPLLDAAEGDALRRLPLPSRDEIAERAIANRDPHVIKLANVGLLEEERTADPLYRFIAAHVVGLTPSARDVVSRRA